MYSSTFNRQNHQPVRYTPPGIASNGADAAPVAVTPITDIAVGSEVILPESVVKTFAAREQVTETTMNASKIADWLPAVIKQGFIEPELVKPLLSAYESRDLSAPELAPFNEIITYMQENFHGQHSSDSLATLLEATSLYAASLVVESLNDACEPVFSRLIEKGLSINGEHHFNVYVENLEGCYNLNDEIELPYITATPALSPCDYMDYKKVQIRRIPEPLRDLTYRLVATLCWHANIQIAGADSYHHFIDDYLESEDNKATIQKIANIDLEGLHLDDMDSSAGEEGTGYLIDPASAACMWEFKVALGDKGWDAFLDYLHHMFGVEIETLPQQFEELEYDSAMTEALRFSIEEVYQQCLISAQPFLNVDHFKTRTEFHQQLQDLPDSVRSEYSEMLSRYNIIAELMLTHNTENDGHFIYLNEDMVGLGESVNFWFRDPDTDSAFGEFLEERENQRMQGNEEANLFVDLTSEGFLNAYRTMQLGMLLLDNLILSINEFGVKEHD